MATETRRKLTPKDRGREIDPDEFDAATGKEGSHYELINGRVYVSPASELPEADLETWIGDELRMDSRNRPGAIT